MDGGRPAAVGTLMMRIAICTVSAWTGLIVLLFPSAAAISAAETSDRCSLSTARIFGTKEFEARKWGPACWLEGGSAYTTLEASQTPKDGKDVVRYDAESGNRRVLVSASNLIPPDELKPLDIEGYAWSKDLNRLLIFTNSKRVWRQNTRGDYWIFHRDTRQLQKLGGPVKPSTMMFASLSPDGSRVAYVCRNNLYVQDLATLRIRQLTSDGSDSMINGTSDWVYEEEFGLQKGYRWSPDGKQIAYWQIDTSGVRDFPIINNTATPYHPTIHSFKYPKVGETNSACRIGIVASAGGATRWLDTNADPRNHYIPGMEWAPNSRSIVLQQLNRLQNNNCVIRCDAGTGETRTVFTDRDDAWVDINEKWQWIEKGKRFLWLSERGGWRQLYAVSRSGKTVTLLTPGKFDVINIGGVDEKRNWVYFTASPTNPTQAYLYRASLDGRGEAARATPDGQPGTHGYEIAPGCRWAAHTWSRFGQPPLTELVSLPEHKRVRVLADNAKLRASLQALKPCPGEFFRVDIGRGMQLDAWSIKPPGFDPSKRYPLLIYVYGEPASQTVLDRWGGDDYLWHRMLAEQGYLVMSIENRGTDFPRGREWRKSIYRQIGILASADQAAATRQILKQRPYVDPKRIGIWGWSGGGSMSLNAIFRYPDLYRTAMAIAFVSDQRLYDTVYQERYMGLPDDNQAGYRNGSPITFARQLKGNLLLVHGTGDDNCHYQSCELLVNELIKHDKPFSMMAYPNRSHSINEGENTTRHLFETLTRFLKQNLPAGPE